MLINPTYQIREARLDDAEAIATIHIKSWQETYQGIVSDNFLASMDLSKRAKRWQEWLGDINKTKSSCKVLVAEEIRSGIVGFAFGGEAREMSDHFDAELYALYLLSEHKGQGLGRLLVSALSQELHKVGFTSLLVWVLTANLTKDFYRHLGGQEISSKVVTIDNKELEEISYGWHNITNLY